MNVMNLVAFLIIGAVAGWIAGNLMKGRGFGLMGNMIVGVIGALCISLVLSLIATPVCYYVLVRLLRLDKTGQVEMAPNLVAPPGPAAQPTARTP